MPVIILKKYIMKLRNGFVSNSSSSSFIIDGSLNNKFILVEKKDNSAGRCVKCDATDLCGLPRIFRCKANMNQHYKNLKKLRKKKLEKLLDI